MKHISVIVIYERNNPGVKDCVESVLGSSDYLDPDVDFFTTVETLESNLPNRSRARNEMAKCAEGDVLVFIDSDAVASDFWLHELIKPFRDEKVGAVGGPNLLKSTAGYREVLADKLLAFPLATWKSSSRYRVAGRQRDVDESELTSCNLAVRKDVFWEAGGFPLNLIPCEENVLLENIQKCGYRLVYNPMAIVFHDRAPLIRPHLRKIFYYARGRGKMIRRRKGGLKLFPRPSKDFVILGAALILHYVAYVLGLIWGFLRND